MNLHVMYKCLFKIIWQKLKHSQSQQGSEFSGKVRGFNQSWQGIKNQICYNKGNVIPHWLLNDLDTASISLVTASNSMNWPSAATLKVRKSMSSHQGQLLVAGWAACGTWQSIHLVSVITIKKINMWLKYKVTVNAKCRYLHPS